MSDPAALAERFRSLHHGPHILVLPNAWDVPSARLFEDAGFPAVATSSAGLMASLGYPDGEEIPKRDYLAAIRRIATKLSVPLSADVVAGFGRTPSAVVATIKGALAAGAVGINLEDQDPTSHQLFPLEAQVRKIRAIRKLEESTGIPLVVNARTDALWRAPGEPDARLQEAIRRGMAYRDAGADCVYPMRLTTAAEISTFVQAVQCPVNVMVRKGLPSISELEQLGVKRVSFGPGASYVTMGLLRRVSEEVLQRGTFETLLEGAITFDELNQLAMRRNPASR